MKSTHSPLKGPGRGPGLFANAHTHKERTRSRPVVAYSAREMCRGLESGRGTIVLKINIQPFKGEMLHIHESGPGTYFCNKEAPIVRSGAHCGPEKAAAPTSLGLQKQKKRDCPI